MVDTILLKTQVLEIMEQTRKWHAKREYQNMTREQFGEAMQNKFNFLYNNSSTLFDRCIIGDINLQQLDYMISMINKVNNGSNYQTVTQEVGQKLVDIYVKPLIEK